MPVDCIKNQIKGKAFTFYPVQSKCIHSPFKTFEVKTCDSLVFGASHTSLKAMDFI